MRKEYRRSLLVWPAAAAVTITAMSWFTIGGTVTTFRYAKSVALAFDAVVLRDDIGALTTDIELSARKEHGARAMKLPERVAGVFASDEISLKAPVRIDGKELAGLVLLMPNNIPASDLRNADDLHLGDLFAAQPIANDRTLSADQAIDTDALPKLRNRTHAQVIPRRTRSDRMVVPDGSRHPQSSEPEVVALSEPSSMLPMSNRALGKLSSLQPKEFRQPQTDLQSATTQRAISGDTPIVTIKVEKVASDVLRSADRSPAGWPATQRLDEQLNELSILALKDRSVSPARFVSSSVSSSPMLRWSDEVSKRLKALQALPRLGDPRAGTLINELSHLARQGERSAEEITDRTMQIQWLCTSYAVARRHAVWQPVWEVASTLEPTWMVSDEPIAGPPSISEAIEAVRADLDDTGDAPGWTDYLLLDEIENLAITGASEQRTILAKRFLSRLNWHALDPEHLRWLKRDSITQLSMAIRPLARGAVDYANLMSLIERQESDAVDLAAVQIADAVQTLRFADNPKAVRVADAITTHYRNANIRLAISQGMLQRMLPSLNTKSVPVHTRMFGSRVRGTSSIQSDLQVQLSPSANTWSLNLKTTGKVRSESTGVNGPVAIRTRGDSQFVATTPIQVNSRGLQVADTDVSVHGQTRLRGIRSEYDRVPMIGSLIRRIAEMRYESLAGRSNLIASRMIERQVGTEINAQVQQRLGAATGRFRNNTLGTLRELSLDPRVMDMQTTDQRLLARYRLAGDWQLAAFTPRPRAPAKSLMSIQVHQSALNNTLEQLVPRDQPMSIRDVIRDSAERFRQFAVQLPADIPENVTVQFARTRPITLEIRDGQLWVTLRIVRLAYGNRNELTKFIVRAVYNPEINGLGVSLVRDGHLRISGPGMSMRERLPVRTIFNKILSPNRPVRLTLPQIIDQQSVQNLAISQLELRAGWIGIAVSESHSPGIAIAKQ